MPVATQRSAPVIAACILPKTPPGSQHYDSFTLPAASTQCLHIHSLVIKDESNPVGTPAA